MVTCAGHHRPSRRSSRSGSSVRESGMSTRFAPPRQRLVVAWATISLFGGLLGGATGVIAPAVVGATPPASSSPGLFATSTAPVEPRLVGPTATATVPAGFVDTTLFTGLTEPTKIQIAADGRVFVAEKSGLILEFQSLDDPNAPTVWADLSSEVDDYWDRGLLGFALSPNFVTDHTLYVQYGYDHNPVSDIPGNPYGAPTSWNDVCPTPPGPNTDGCTILGRISRIAGVPSGTPLGQANQRSWCRVGASNTRATRTTTYGSARTVICTPQPARGAVSRRSITANWGARPTRWSRRSIHAVTLRQATSAPPRHSRRPRVAHYAPRASAGWRVPVLPYSAGPYCG